MASTLPEVLALLRVDGPLRYAAQLETHLLAPGLYSQIQYGQYGNAGTRKT